MAKGLSVWDHTLETPSIFETYSIFFPSCTWMRCRDAIMRCVQGQQVETGEAFDKYLLPYYEVQVGRREKHAVVTFQWEKNVFIW